MIQISSNLRINIRPVQQNDQSRLANLLHFESHVHRHLDWVSPLDLLDTQPFIVVEQDGKIEAALSCPIDPIDVAWIRLFAASGAISYEAAWQLLWKEVRKQLLNVGCKSVAAIALFKWFADLLERNGFQRVQDVIFLKWEDIKMIESVQLNTISIRPMELEDLNKVAQIDHAAFKPIWRNSIQSLNAAFEQSHIATVAVDQEGLVGYQISTAGHVGGHLARLAVLPRAQGQHIGKAILVDVLRKFQAMNIRRISVNTQEDNIKSINLYERTGFVKTGERYSVFEFPFDR